MALFFSLYSDFSGTLEEREVIDQKSAILSVNVLIVIDSFSCL